MVRKWQYWTLIGTAAIGCTLVAVNAGLYVSNRLLQEQASGRAQYIQQSQQIGALYQEIAKALAKLAIERHDEDVKALLTHEGFTINQTPVNSATGSRSK